MNHFFQISNLFFFLADIGIIIQAENRIQPSSPAHLKMGGRGGDEQINVLTTLWHSNGAFLFSLGRNTHTERRLSTRLPTRSTHSLFSLLFFLQPHPAAHVCVARRASGILPNPASSFFFPKRKKKTIYIYKRERRVLQPALVDRPINQLTPPLIRTLKTRERLPSPPLPFLALVAPYRTRPAVDLPPHTRRPQHWVESPAHTFLVPARADEDSIPTRSLLYLDKKRSLPGHKEGRGP